MLQRLSQCQVQVHTIKSLHPGMSKDPCLRMGNSLLSTMTNLLSNLVPNVSTRTCWIDLNVLLGRNLTFYYGEGCFSLTGKDTHYSSVSLSWHKRFEENSTKSLIATSRESLFTSILGGVLAATVCIWDTWSLSPSQSAEYSFSMSIFSIYRTLRWLQDVFDVPLVIQLTGKSDSHRNYAS